MRFGLINVTPEDAAGEKFYDMTTAVIDIDKNTAGVQEGKEWLAIQEYMRAMKDTNGNGIPDIDSRYRNAIKTHFPVK